MRPIKFRGRRPNGEFVYGDLLHKKSKLLIATTHAFKFVVTDVGQFIGTDAIGTEIYEGDVLLDELLNEYPAEIYMRPEKVAQLILKE